MKRMSNKADASVNNEVRDLIKFSMYQECNELITLRL